MGFRGVLEAQLSQFPLQGGLGLRDQPDAMQTEVALHTLHVPATVGAESASPGPSAQAKSLSLLRLVSSLGLG